LSFDQCVKLGRVLKPCPFDSLLSLFNDFCYRARLHE
jgi:hypothetical protein